MADLLLKEGYAVLFPDSFGPRGVREICTQRISSRGISQTERRRDTLGALAWAGRQAWAQPDKVAVLGWSHGGSAVLAATDAGQAEVAAQGARFARAIAFYPGCAAALKANYRPNTPLTMLLAENDDWTPAAPCVELGSRVAAEVHVYPDSYHGFDGPSGRVVLRADVPNGVRPGQGVHVGPNPIAREQALALVRRILCEALQ